MQALKIYTKLAITGLSLGFTIAGVVWYIGYQMI